MNPKSCYYYTCQYGHKEYIVGDSTALRYSLEDCTTGGGYLYTTGGTAEYTLTAIPSGTEVVNQSQTYQSTITDMVFELAPSDTEQEPGLYQEKIKFTDIDGNVITLHCCTVWLRRC